MTFKEGAKTLIFLFCMIVMAWAMAWMLYALVK